MSVQAVAYWNDDSEMQSVCAICRNDLEESCIDCCIAEKGAEVCELICGVCGHCYHAHCLVRFLKSRETCPLG